jgi:phosphate/sulfate permease
MDATILTIIVLAISFGLYMAWGIGANDVANAMGTSVGSGALTLRRAVILAAVLEFSGAFLVGAHVSDTVRQGIVDPVIFAGDGVSFMLGMLSALLAAGLWLQIASWKGWPVSTTHSIVGAVVGFGAVYGGIQAVHWDKMSQVVASWFISPLLSATISYFIFRLVLRYIFYNHNPLRAAQRLAPYLVFTVITVLTLSLVFKGLNNLNLDLSFASAFSVASLAGIVAALLSAVLVARMKTPDEGKKRDDVITDPAVVRALEKTAKQLERAELAAPGHMKGDLADLIEEVRRLRFESQKRYEYHTNSSEYQSVEKLFVYLQILSASCVAFAHGANDVANAIGPMSAVMSVALAGGATIAAKSPVSIWMLALGGAGIVVGLATWGWRVIETVGRNITHLTPTRGFSAEFGAAATILLASKLGLPVSTTHTLVGAVLGVGLARGISAVNLNMVRDVIISWVVTLPVGAGLAIVIFYLLRLFF